MSESPWIVVKTLCRVCNNEEIVVCPLAADPDDQECGRCHQMTADVTHYERDGVLIERE